MIEANNIFMKKRVVIAAAHLRNIAADWYKIDKANIIQYVDRNVMNFIR